MARKRPTQGDAFEKCRFRRGAWLGCAHRSGAQAVTLMTGSCADVTGACGDNGAVDLTGTSTEWTKWSTVSRLTGLRTPNDHALTASDGLNVQDLTGLGNVWTPFAMSFTADDASLPPEFTTLSTADSCVGLDHLTISAVPETATAWMWATGLLVTRTNRRTGAARRAAAGRSSS